MNQIKIYFASKREHANMIRGYRPEGFHFSARWIDTANLAINAAKPASHWLEENFDDIRACDYVLVYAEEGEVLKTALIEVGYAMAFGKKVYVIGDHDSYRPWRAAILRVSFARTIEDALQIIKRAHTVPGKLLDV